LSQNNTVKGEKSDCENSFDLSVAGVASRDLWEKSPLLESSQSQG